MKDTIETINEGAFKDIVEFIEREEKAHGSDSEYDEGYRNSLSQVSEIIDGSSCIQEAFYKLMDSRVTIMKPNCDRALGHDDALENATEKLHPWFYVIKSLEG